MAPLTSAWGTPRDEWPWLGVGALLGFVFVSLILGALERWRGNSPKAFRAKIDAVKIQSFTIGTQKRRIEDLEKEERVQKQIIDDLGKWKARKKIKSKTKKRRIAELEDEKKELLEKVGWKDAVIVEKDEEIERKNQELEARDETITTKEDTIRTLTIEQSELSRDLTATRTQLNRVEASEQRLLQQVNFQLEEVLERNAEITRQSRQIAELKQSLENMEELRREMSGMRARIADLERNEARLHQRWIHLLAEVGKKDDELERKHRETEQKDAIILEHEDTIEALRQSAVLKNEKIRDLSGADERARRVEEREQALMKRVNYLLARDAQCTCRRRMPGSLEE